MGIGSHIEQFHYPSSVREACELLAEDEHARVIAGGTALALSSLGSIDTLIDITRLGLDRLEETDEGLTIGATVTAQQLVQYETIMQYSSGILAHAAGQIGSRQIRNQVTIGGNIVQLYPWSDLPLPLIAMNAQARIAPRDRTISVEALVAEPPSQKLDTDAIVTDFIIPRTMRDRTGCFIKFSKTVGDHALASVAVTARRDEERVAALTAVIGGSTRRPVRLHTVENMLRDSVPTHDMLDDILLRAEEMIEPRTDTRAGEKYRAHLTAVLLRRALAHCLGLSRAGGGR